MSKVKTIFYMFMILFFMFLLFYNFEGVTGVSGTDNYLSLFFGYVYDEIVIDPLSCDGIEFYDNWTVVGAIDDINSKDYELRFGALDVKRFVTEEEKGDCESVSLAVKCLLERRNLSYRFYTKGHIGVELEIDGEWQIVS